MAVPHAAAVASPVRGDPRAARWRALPSLLHVRGLLLLRAAAATAAIGGVMAFVIAPLQGRFTGEFEDFQDYLAASRAVAGHSDIYASFLNHVQPVPVQGFDYPPVIAWILQPLAWTSSTSAATAWMFLLLGCTVAGTAVIAYAVLPASWPRAELTAIAAMLYAPLTYNLWHGQMSAVVYLLLALALRSWLGGRQVSLGVFVGIAACIKIAPVVLVVIMIRRGWWRASASLLATLAAGVGGGILAFGVGPSREYIGHVLPVLAWQNGWVYNQSAAGVVNRLLLHSVLAFQASSLLVTLVTIGVAAAVTVVAALAVRRGERAREVRAAEFAVAILAMLLAGTVTWFWHLGALLIALAAAAALLASQRVRRPRLMAIATVAALLASGVLAPLLIASASLQGLIGLSHTWLWWPALQVVSAPAIAMSALFVALALELRRMPPTGTKVSPR